MKKITLPTLKNRVIFYIFVSNNLTGAKSKRIGKANYALQNKSLILFDAAYEAFIQDKDIPHSIYEIEEQRIALLNLDLFSKNAGFTGVRCAFTVIPKNLSGLTPTNEEIDMVFWNRRQSTNLME